MGGRIDLTGRVFGRLAVMSPAPSRDRRSYWLCQCTCGNVYEARSDLLKSGNTRSCGCLKLEMSTQTSIRHGVEHHALYLVWFYMKQRCEIPESESYHSHGALGITVCPEWRDDVRVFYAWALDNGYAPGLHIDRMDADADFSPDNCRFVDRKTKQRNRRSNRIIDTPQGPMILCDAAAASGLNRETLSRRVSKGWPIERLFEPPQRSN